MAEENLHEIEEKMARDWDERAQENAKYYVATGEVEWEDEAFFQSGERAVAEQVDGDLEAICQGREPGRMRVIEIGCGVGRMTRALARRFGEVHGVDVSGEMVRQARENLAGVANARVYRNNGRDLAVLPVGPYDFAFSSIVFQHIPSKPVIRCYFGEVGRLLAAGALFKLQLQGNTELERDEDDTWVGVSYSEAEVRELAESAGFEVRQTRGAGTQDFWVWLRRR